MINQIEQWIDKTNEHYLNKRVSCKKFIQDFDGFYSEEFLRHSYFVVVDEVPKPDMPELREMGLGSMLDMEVHAITYKNTYYIQPYLAHNLRLHFHELVHVAQWNCLGPAPLIKRYINEFDTYGYEGSALEIMAYALDAHFMEGGDKMDIPSYVAKNL